MTYKFGDWVTHPTWGRGIVLGHAQHGVRVGFASVFMYLAAQELTPIDSPERQALRQARQALTGDYPRSLHPSIPCTCGWRPAGIATLAVIDAALKGE